MHYFEPKFEYLKYLDCTKVSCSQYHYQSKTISNEINEILLIKSG